MISQLKCQKIPHVGTGHLHGENSDAPYDVDGWWYCGRCHAACDREGRCGNVANHTSWNIASERLSFATLRKANTTRLPLFKNGRGERAHSEADGSDWALSAWCNAVTGELGELANLIKKVERGDFTLDEAREALGKEAADVATYLDILAFRIGVDLGVEVAAKFNEVSKRVGAAVFIHGDEVRSTP